jgi:hypothetical protein
LKPIKKPQYPNWKHQEIICLVQANRVEPDTSLDVVNFKDCFESVVMKWKKVSVTMMGVGHNTHVRDLHARKNGSQCMIITKEFETTWQG